jgi:hypothetical protein
MTLLSSLLSRAKSTPEAFAAAAADPSSN